MHLCISCISKSAQLLSGKGRNEKLLCATNEIQTGAGHFQVSIVSYYASINDFLCAGKHHETGAMLVKMKDMGKNIGIRVHLMFNSFPHSFSWPHKWFNQKWKIVIPVYCMLHVLGSTPLNETRMLIIS